MTLKRRCKPELASMLVPMMFNMLKDGLLKVAFIGPSCIARRLRLCNYSCLWLFTAEFIHIA